MATVSIDIPLPETTETFRLQGSQRNDDLVRVSRHVVTLPTDAVVRVNRQYVVAVPASAQGLVERTRLERWLELCLAGMMLIVSIPVILTGAVLMRLTSRGSGFYRQKRVGTGGRIFEIVKLRTMYQNAEGITGPVWASKNDSRITGLGGELRRFHIDELPQLLNVLCGEMSLIGPRPERPEIIFGLERQLPDYRRRLCIKPGLTGLAQIQLPPDSDIESVRLKLLFDLYYVKHRCFTLDLKILLGTVGHLFGIRREVVVQWLGIPNLAAVLASHEREQSAA